jgi:uncharacterized protein YbjT (DUF2867 family)
MILVTTAGKVGAETARLLRERDVPVRVLVRDPDKAAARTLAQAGAEIALGDLGVPASVDEAMRGVSGVVLVSPAVPAQELNVVASAAQAGVGHVVKATSKAPADSPIARRRWQAEIEAGLAASGIPHTLLRSNAYMQNVLMLAPAIATTSTFGSAAGPGRTGLVDARDVAAVAAEIITSPAAHAGKTYWLTGPEFLSNYDVAAVLSKLLQDHHLPGAHLRAERGRDDPRRNPRADRGDERPGVQPDRRRRRRMGHPGRPVAPGPSRPLLRAVHLRLRCRVLLDIRGECVTLASVRMCSPGWF